MNDVDRLRQGPAMRSILGHARQVAFQPAEVTVRKNLFAEILRMFDDLPAPPIE